MGFHSFDVGTQIGPYILLALLGEGGMGIVHLAEHSGSGERVALKTLTAAKPKMVRSLRREIQALKRLQHPHIVRILDEGVTDSGVPWYAMTLLEGIPLDEVFRNSASVQPSDSLSTSLERTNLLEKLLEAPEGQAFESRTNSRLALWTTQLSSTMADNSINPTKSWNFEQKAASFLPELSEADDAINPAPKICFDDHIVQQKLKYMVQITHALAYLHGMGLVHCDLKPENVVVTLDGRAVLVDFGLVATRSDETPLTNIEDAGLMAGTALYMAPERIQGKDFDARLDLYAIGCMLFEVLTGRLAFLRETSYESFAAKLSGKIPLLEDYITEVPEILSSLTSQLMALRPEDRPSNSLVVLAKMRMAGLENTLALEGQPTPRPHIYPAAFFGRDNLMKTCKRWVKKARAGATQFLMLCGESGVGKSRLAAELVRYVRSQQAEILVGQCSVMQGVVADARRCPAMGAFARILEFIALRFEKAEFIAPGDRAHVIALAQFIPAFRRLLGESSLSVARPLDIESTRQRLFRAVVHVLKFYLGRRPAVLVFEDLQWADDWSLRVLTYLQRVATEQRWMILGTYRSDEMSTDLEEFANLPGVKVVKVGRLPESFSQEMLISMLGVKDIPKNLLTFVNRHAAGNPFFVVSCVRAAVEEGFLGLNEEGQWTFDESGGLQKAPMPTTLTQLVSRRLELLDSDAQRLVQSASLLGREFDLEMLEYIAEVDNIDNVLATLVTRDVLEAREGSARYRFVHDKLVEITYADLERDAERCTKLHQRAAFCLKEWHESGREIDLSQLGWHLQASRQFTEARLVYFDAARQATDEASYIQAEEHLVSGLWLTAEDDLASLKTKLYVASKVLIPQGRNTEAERWIREVLEQSSVEQFAQAYAEGLKDLGYLLWRTGQMEQALSTSYEARDLCRQQGSRLGECEAIYTIANVYHQQGQLEKAHNQFSEALNLARKVGDRRLQGKCLGSLGNLCFTKGRYEESLEYYNGVLAISHEIGDKRLEGMCLGNIAGVFFQQDNFEEAFFYYREALRLAREIGDIACESIWLEHLAEILKKQGRIEEALAYAENALGLTRESGDLRMEACVLLSLGELHRMIGALNDARRWLDASMALFRELGMKHEFAITLCELAHLKLHKGEAVHEELNQVQAIAQELSIVPTSVLAKSVAELERAMAAQERGETLRFGQCLDDYPEALRNKWTSQ